MAYETQRPYKLGSPIDDRPETAHCVLYLFVLWASDRHLSIEALLRDAGGSIGLEDLDHAQKSARKQGVIVPREWGAGKHSSANVLAWDLLDIGQPELAEIVRSHTI